MSEADTSGYGRLCAAAAAAGLACRGGFHPRADDDVPVIDHRPARTVVLLGFTGREHWPAFTASPEYGDGAAHPLDRWSRRVIEGLARRFGARPLYPFGGPPWWPFQRWAQRAERLHPSPLGVLMHAEFGLWHAYRGALLLPEELPVPPLQSASSPCESCREQPCLAACPAGAYAGGRFSPEACRAHVLSEQGIACRTYGCLARHACPVATAHRYDAPQATFHLHAFLRAPR